MVRRIGHQLRVSPQGIFLGFDFNAAFAMASALGVPDVAVAEFLPPIEAAAIAQMNARKRNT